MRIRIYKKENGWHSKLLRGNGGKNYLVIGSINNTFLGCLKIFTFKNLIKACRLK